MIESSSLYLAKRIKTLNPEETPSVDIMRYSIKFIILNVITFVLIIVSGLIFSDLRDVMICSAAFIGLRFFSGGYHIGSAWWCAITSTVAVQLFVLFGEIVADNRTFTSLLNYITLGLILIFSPSNIEKQTKFKREHYKWLKIGSVLIVILNIFVVDNILLTSSFFFQGLTLINFFKGEVKRNEKSSS